MIQLRQYRKERDLTQEQLAHALGCTTHVVWLWESGNIKRPRTALRRALVAFFGVSVEQLFAPVNENSPDTVSAEAA